MTSNHDWDEILKPDPIGDTVRALFGPKPPTPTATLRVAVLYPEGVDLAKAAREGGLDVAYEHMPDKPNDKLDISKLPEFDLVAANLPDDNQGRDDVVAFLFRFLWVRRPLAFLMVGGIQDELTERGLVERMEAKYDRMGYVVQRASAITGVGLPEEDELTFFFGERVGEGFPWWGFARPRRQSGENNNVTGEGSGDEPSIDTPESGRLNLPITQEIMERIARFIIED